jgi:hypothetical protein
MILLWAGKDSNLRRPEPTDLQSVAFNHFATCPPLVFNDHAISIDELATRLELVTC